MNKFFTGDVLARLVRGVSLLLCLYVSPAMGAQPEPSPLPKELLELSFEDLMEVRVETLARREQRILDTPAAVFVLHADEIKQSGARSIPEALRLVPGLSVARIDATTYSVTSRGFSGRIANKLLVLIDGRTIYTPLFGGVEWDKEPVPIDLVDRIEVVRGPGASLWGANAVNGVINIVTRRAAQEDAGEVILGGGTEDRGVAGFRWEDAVGDLGFFRVNLDGQRRDGGLTEAGEQAEEGWERVQAGMRFDLSFQNGDRLVMMGDWATNRTDQAFVFPQRLPPFQRRVDGASRYTGGSGLVRWTRPLEDGGHLQLQGYFSRYLSDAPDVDQAFNTYDMDFQHDAPWGDGHSVVYGVGLRYVSDQFVGTRYFRIAPEADAYLRASAFVENAFALVPGHLVLTLGSKLEYNEFTGFEAQPRIALRGNISDRHTLWAAVSRAVRTPSRIEVGADIWAQTLPFARLVVAGNRDLEAEALHAFEMGYRVQATEELGLDLALFYNRYRDLRS